LTLVIAFHYTRLVTGAQVKRVREALGLTQHEFAKRLGVHAVTVAKWETDAQGMRGPAARLITLLGEGATKVEAQNAQAPRTKVNTLKTGRGTKRKMG
jgi:DNA-binding transcriptional regulator YiaG